MQVTLKHGGAGITLDLAVGSSLKDLQEAVELATGVIVRKQKLLCKGKVLTSLPSSTPLADLDVRSGTKIMLLDAAAEAHGATALKHHQEQKQRAAKQRIVLGAQKPKESTAIAATAQRRVEIWAKTGIAALRDLKLLHVPPDLFSPQIAGKLRILDIGGNCLTSVPTDIAHLVSLQKLRLSMNQMTDDGTPWAGISTLPCLQVLAIDHNRLTTLPPAIGSLPRLQKLAADHNNIERVPDEIGLLISLRALSLGCNNLTGLPPSLAECSMLEELDASGNAIREIPSEFGSLPNLRILLLNKNLIRSVPAQVLLAPSLNTLDLHDCPITLAELRGLPGYDAFDARRRAKHDKQVDMKVLRHGGGFDPGADVQEWQHWRDS